MVRPAKRKGTTSESTPESNKIKVLVLCNGIGMSEPVIYHQTQNKEEQVQSFRKTVHSHISDFDECIIKFIPKMDENSSIINLSSFASFDGWAGEAAFAAGCAATQKNDFRIFSTSRAEKNPDQFNSLQRNPKSTHVLPGIPKIHAQRTP